MLIIIPARLESSRLPRKVLLEAGGKPLIQWTVEAALAADIGVVVVASDSVEVLQAVHGHGLMKVRTGPHSCGSDRAAFAERDFRGLGGLTPLKGVTIVLQADEPLIQPEHLRALVKGRKGFPRCDIATLCTSLSIGDVSNPNVVKVGIGTDGFAKSFSRQWGVGTFRHVGVYAFPPGGLQWFAGLPKTETESLEQTRALHAGARIRCVTVDHPHHGIDTAEQFEAFKRVVEGGR